MTQLRMRISATVPGSSDPQPLGSFYARPLGWTVAENQAMRVMVRPPSGGTGLSFQHEPHYVRLVWPAVPGGQQMTSHLDIAVEALEAGMAWALEVGAAVAGFQPQEHVRVMLDPAGHPFCRFVVEF